MLTRGSASPFVYEAVGTPQSDAATSRQQGACQLSRYKANEVMSSLRICEDCGGMNVLAQSQAKLGMQNAASEGGERRQTTSVAAV